MRIIFIVGIVLLIIAMGILIPIIFSVQKTNTKVFSLFGIIPLQEIRILAEKCEKYLIKFMEEKNDSGKQSMIKFFKNK